MRRSLVVTTALVLCTTLAAQRGGRRRDRGPAPDPKLTHFDFKVEQYEAPSIERGTAEFAIYLPKGWDAEQDPLSQKVKQYPLVVWLHGMNGSYRRFHMNDGPQILDELREKKKIPEMIFVAISASRRPVYLNGTRGGDYEDMITKDLIGHLEKNYPVAKQRDQRAIMGVSIGGMGALTMALNTDTFGTVAAHSSVVLPASLEGLEGRMANRVERMAEGYGLGDLIDDPEKWAKVSPLALVQNLDKETLEALNIYFDAGDSDRYGFAPANEQLHKALEKREIEHTWELVKGGEHAWGSGSTQKQLPKSLAFVGKSFLDAQPKTKGRPGRRNKAEEAAKKKQPAEAGK